MLKLNKTAYNKQAPCGMRHVMVILTIKFIILILKLLYYKVTKLYENTENLLMFQ